MACGGKGGEKKLQPVRTFKGEGEKKAAARKERERGKKTFGATTHKESPRPGAFYILRNTVENFIRLTIPA